MDLNPLLSYSQTLCVFVFCGPVITVFVSPSPSHTHVHHMCTAAGCSDSTGPVPSSGGSTSPTTAEGDTQHSERLSHKGSSVPTKHGAKIDFVKRNIEVLIVHFSVHTHVYVCPTLPPY